MYLIKEILVSAEVFQRKFVCNIAKCHGACCWEGDFGAPVEEEEMEQIEKAYHIISSLLSEKSKKVVKDKGMVHYDREYGGEVTPLLPDGSCAYLTKNEKGHATCSFQMAFNQGEIDFIKPVSCQLYPLRVTKNDETGFEAINYDEWDICSDACSLGEELSMPVFRFVKDALIRKYGDDFYNEMEQVYEHISEKSV